MGASSANYTVATADVGDAVACTVTATNSAGEGEALSAPVRVAVLGAGLASAGQASVSATSTSTALTCTGATACTVTLSMSVIETLKSGKVVAVRLAAGQSQKVHVKLNNTGQQLLKTHRKLPVKITVVQSKNGAAVVISSYTVTFKAPRKK
jgi:hypothetical protein